MARDGKVKYIFRHWDPHYENREYLSLHGYGVELALKSVEYKVIDDSSKEENEDEQNVEEVNVVNGIDFSILSDRFKKLSITQYRYPSLSSELLSFKASLLSGEYNFQELKNWEIKGDCFLFLIDRSLI